MLTSIDSYAPPRRRPRGSRRWQICAALSTAAALGLATSGAHGAFTFSIGAPNAALIPGRVVVPVFAVNDGNETGTLLRALQLTFTANGGGFFIRASNGGTPGNSADDVVDLPNALGPNFDSASPAAGNGFSYVRVGTAAQTTQADTNPRLADPYVAGPIGSFEVIEATTADVNASPAVNGGAGFRVAVLVVSSATTSLTLGGLIAGDVGATQSVPTRTFPMIAAGPAWNVNTNGVWSAGNNWSGGVVPSGVGVPVALGNVITSPRTVTLDAPRTVGALNFASSNPYTIGGANALTIDVPNGINVVNVSAGAHVVDAPVVLADSTTVIVTPAAGSIAFRGGVGFAPAATGRLLTKDGAGTASFTNVRAGELHLQAGTVCVPAQPTRLAAAGTSTLGALTLASGGTLDLTNNGLILGGGGPARLALLREEIVAGRVISSTLAAGQALAYYENPTSGPRPTFGGVGVTAGQILIAATLRGDANLDLVVNFLDLVALAQNYNSTVGTISWQRGDFTYDGAIGFADLVTFAQNYAQTTASIDGGGEPFSAAFAADWALAQALVPEPATLAVTVGLTLATSLRRRRRAARAE